MTDSSNELQHTIVTIHQIACHLLNVGSRKDSVMVNISLHSMTMWTVNVQYEGFRVSETRDTVGEALRAVLGDLAKRLLDRLEGETPALDAP